MGWLDKTPASNNLEITIKLSIESKLRPIFIVLCGDTES